jgi:prophage antirepressor-like protein
MQYELQIFEYQDHNAFRVVDIEGEPWFVLADVCRHLDLKSKNGSVSHHADRLDDDERRTVPASVLREAPSLSDREGTRPFTRTMLVINESGLYSLILRSDKPQAKKFKKWVTSEVLPSIRRTGGYAGAVPPSSAASTTIGIGLMLVIFRSFQSWSSAFGGGWNKSAAE